MPRHNGGRFDKNNFGCLEISLQRAKTIARLNDAEIVQLAVGFVALYRQRAQILSLPLSLSHRLKFASLFVPIEAQFALK